MASLRDSHRVGRVDLLEVMHAHARATALDWSRHSETGTDAMHVVRPSSPPSSCADAMHVGSLPPSARGLALGSPVVCRGSAGGSGRAFMKAPASPRKPRIPVLASAAGMCGVVRAGERARHQPEAASLHGARRAWCTELCGVVCGAWLRDAVQQSRARGACRRASKASPTSLAGSTLVRAACTPRMKPARPLRRRPARRRSTA